MCNALLDNNDAQGMDRFMRQQINKMPLSELGKAEFEAHYRSFEKQINNLYAA